VAHKVNRNDPCPCGSGKKYKKCCMLKERDLSAVRADNREIVQEAINWVTIKHGETLKHWVETAWFDGIDATQRKGISTADQSIQNIHDTNLLEYMMAEGVFVEPPVDDADEEAEAADDKKAADDRKSTTKPVPVGPVMKLVLGAVENLSDAQREYLEQLSKRPLRLYQVTETDPGSSFKLRAYPAGKGEEFTIEDKWISRQLDVGDTVGLRLVQTGGVWETSGAVYHIPSEYLEELQAKLDEAGEAGYASALIRFWLELVAAHV